MEGHSYEINGYYHISGKTKFGHKRGHREGLEDKDNTGHNDSKNRGNFLELVEFLSKYDPCLERNTSFESRLVTR